MNNSEQIVKALVTQTWVVKPLVTTLVTQHRVVKPLVNGMSSSVFFSGWFQTAAPLPEDSQYVILHKQLQSLWPQEHIQ